MPNNSSTLTKVCISCSSIKANSELIILPKYRNQKMEIKTNQGERILRVSVLGSGHQGRPFPSPYLKFREMLEHFKGQFRKNSKM